MCLNPFLLLKGFGRNVGRHGGGSIAFVRKLSSTLRWAWDWGCAWLRPADRWCWTSMRLANSKLRSSVFSCVVKWCRLEVREEVVF